MYKFTMDDIEKVYKELERRLMIALEDGDAENAHDLRVDMLQGVYGTLMVLASNWPEVRSMCDMIEQQYEY